MVLTQNLFSGVDYLYTLRTTEALKLILGKLHIPQPAKKFLVEVSDFLKVGDFAEALVAATREIALEVNADKTKYMVMSRYQNAGRIRSVRIDNTTFDRVEEFKYLGTNLTNQNSIAEEIKSRLRSGNACYHFMQNLLSSRLLSKNLKFKIYRTIILPVVLKGCETWLLTLQEGV